MKIIKKNGWYEYSDIFVNVLVSLDQADDKNGTLQISQAHKKSFKIYIQKHLKMTQILQRV